MPALFAHHVTPLLFDIGSRLSPASIRDQMIRGKLIADRAREERLIGPTRPLLVIGAGAGGATAALVASMSGVPTLLVDSAPRPFSVQASCSTRYVDPTQYDWPVDTWK